MSLDSTGTAHRLTLHRTPDNCPQLVCTENSEGSRSNNCRLLAELLEGGTADLAAVDERICSACCSSFPPSPTAWNPVISSLVYDRVQRVLATGSDAFERAHCDRLLARAKRGLEVLLSAATVVAQEESGPRPEPRATIRELLPPPSGRSGTPVRSWSVGITTAPRRVSTLERCLDSVIAAGWTELMLFVDGAVQVPHRYGSATIVWREPAIGPWPNYLLALSELLLRQPDADAYLLIQDDTLFPATSDVRKHLEEILWPGDAPGLVSLFCPRPLTQPQSGWYQRAAPWGYSSLAFIFPRDIAREVVVSRGVQNHRLRPDGQGLIGIPEAIGSWAVEHGVPFHFPCPSLVQHIGDTSTIWDGTGSLGPHREAEFFAGDLLETAEQRKSSGEWAPSVNRPPLHSYASFPESRFPCRPEQQREYWATVERGRERMQATTAVVCGLCRDVLVHLPLMAARLERLQRMFRQLDIVLIENDSTDGTDRWLAAWAKTNTHVHLDLRCAGEPKLVYGTGIDRTVRMAQYRNRYRDRIISQFLHADNVIVLDMDLASGFSFDGIAHTFGCDDWDFVGSNGLAWLSGQPDQTIYYDSFAHRAVGECEPEKFADKNALRLVRGDALIPVWSCFGGLGIYRTQCFELARYYGTDCEHVTFHQELRARGIDRLYLNPSQIVAYTSVPDVLRHE